MDLAYTPEAEAFRVEIRDWLTSNLPVGWGDHGLRDVARGTQGVQRAVAAEAVRRRLDLRDVAEGVRRQGPHARMQGVVLAEEFARVKAPMRADFFGDTLVGPTILQWGTEEQKKEFLPRDPQRLDALVPGLQRAQLRLRSGVAEDHRRARRRRVDHQRSEGVDDRQGITPTTASC